MVPRPGMMTILLILILGRLGQTAVRTAKPDSPYSATRPAPAEYVAELSLDFWPVLLMPGSTSSPSLPGTACWPRATLRCAAGRRNLLTSGLERRDRSPPTTPPGARGRLAMVGRWALRRSIGRHARRARLHFCSICCGAWPGRCLLVGGQEEDACGCRGATVVATEHAVHVRCCRRGHRGRHAGSE